jgi:ribosomal protein S18 acetylase RimI-like enzyme
MSWFWKLRDDWVVARPAEPTDRPALADLQVRAWRRHGMPAVEDQVALLNSGVSTMAFVRDRASGFLGLHVREPANGEVWVDVGMVTLATGMAPGKVMQSMLRAAAPNLAARGVTGAVCLTLESWLRDALAEAGFVEADQVVTYARSAHVSLPDVAPVATLRPAGPGQADELLALNAAAFEPMWRYDAATILSWLFTADHAVLAELDGRPAGFALTSRAQGNGYDQLIRLATHPDAQRQGIGRQLVADAIDYSQMSGAPGLTLNTQLSNNASRHLYEGMGFKTMGAAVRVLICRMDCLADDGR